MKIGLFIPCHVNALTPHIAIATLELLEAYGLDVDYPMAQTCCGQPLFNNGDLKGAAAAAHRFSQLFAGYDYVVAPSSSCVSHTACHYPPHTPGYAALQPRIYEIVEFLQDVLNVSALPKPVYFPHKVSIHQSCHGLRQRNHATASELMLPYQSRLERILALVDGITLTQPQRRDECCGFGGTFCVDEADVSVAMGQDRIAGHAATGAEFIVGAEASCLMHMGGILRHQHGTLRTLHIVEILNGKAAA
ncbi:(Fe-S)-binding protein [Craterilacuibacter sinensis]|uniref:(Fe-S)-binding protein n=1 Tax=Craterilacuibacter sinensis TaxID=2686017 RepID=A0A845BLP9_9NEIS|nr:(Fe-S)-binding protein [Craterilacuibacter sinensis]MXR37255.1 (Fe-S)-binding protein [Craterilacuibacter sinensis]